MNEYRRIFTMRADRLVSILLTLQVHGSMTTESFAERLEVSARTIHRDMEALSAIGIPVFALRGRNGGWKLSEEYRGKVNWMSASEIQALAVRQPATPLSDLGLAGVADAAWLKLVAGLPPLHRDEATRISERIHIEVETWKPRQESTPWLPLVKEAVFAERLIDIRYRNSADGMSDRTLAPLGIVAQGATWYVVAMVDGDIRTYRISRIEQAEMLAEQFSRPDDFVLASWWTTSKQLMAQRLPRYPVRVRIDDASLSMLRRELRWGRIGTIGTVDDNGWHEVDILFELENNALATVLSLGDRVEVLDPPKLREQVVAMLHKSLATYVNIVQVTNN
jgi:predicted DNA-binding transcriptional regulator YafY